MNRTKRTRPKYKAVDFSHLLGNVKGISDELMKIHFKLYEGLVDATNKAISIIDKGNTKNMVEYSSVQKQLPLFFNGMRLHELYFGSMGKGDMSDELFRAIRQSFGSIDKWKANFMATGNIPAVGFVCLMQDKKNDQLYNIWINEFNVGELVGVEILLVMDMWEHAYLCEFGLNTTKYQETFLNNVNWATVSKRFSQ